MMAFIKGMPGFMFFFITAFAFGLAAAAFIAGRKSRQRAALVKDMPTSPIGMVADGYCELEGRIEAVDGAPLLSPLTRQPVAWYHATVERYVGKSKNSTGDGWATVKDQTSGAPFLVRDATGACAIHPWSADVTATDKSLWYGATAIPTDRNPAKVDAKESTSRVVTIEGTANTQFRYYEERIYPGDPLLVLGHFHRGRFDADEEEDEDEPYEDEPAEDEDEAALDREWNDARLVDDVTRRINAVTPAWVGSAPGKPFIVSTRLQAVEIAESDMGGQALTSVALVPLAVGLLLLYARFG
jgi:hypothetical protein